MSVKRLNKHGVPTYIGGELNPEYVALKKKSDLSVMRRATRKWRVNNPEYHKAYDFKRRYGISLERYNQLLESQGGVCAICGGVNENGKQLSVDHDHSSGEVRGLLCTNCNSGIGHFKDDTGLLQKARDYIAINCNKNS